jgi:Mg2+ and Co2+ transporter CorA
MRECRARIDQVAARGERENLLAVTQFLARLRYNDEGLFVILGGRRAMIESPLYQALKEEWACEAVIDVLVARFSPKAKSLETELKAISEESRLKELLKHAATCRSLAAFRNQLEP